MYLTMYQRVAFIVLALFLAAPPSNWMMIAGSIVLFGFAFMMPDKGDGDDSKETDG